ncbi:hypothetical protein [Myroides sp. LJL119]
MSAITYIAIKGSFVYLTTIIDLQDLKPVGWSINKDMSEDKITLTAFKMANKSPFDKGLICYSEQGFQ